jgi:hypothetical protein
MSLSKSITFDKESQDNLPEHIKAKMKADREKARSKFYYLKKGEIIKEGDECGTTEKYNDTGYKWEKETVCVGQPAPDPQYMSHRKYRRLVS